MLRQAGVPCGLIHPSTRLIGYTRTYTEAFVRDVSFLSSGALPWREVPYRLCRVAAWVSICLYLLGWLPLYLGAWRGWPDTACVGAWAIVVGYLGLFAAALPPPKAVIIEGVETFGDLARVLCRTTATASRAPKTRLEIPKVTL